MRHTNGPTRTQQSFTAVLFLAALFVGLGPTEAAAQTHTFVSDTANNRVVVFNTGDSTAVVDTIWRPIAEEQRRLREAGLPQTHRLSELPGLSRRTRRLLGPVQGLLVDG